MVACLEKKSLNVLGNPFDGKLQLLDLTFAPTDVCNM